MKLRDLTKPQFDAALAAADVLMNGHPNSASDRAAWREATSRFASMLPEGADHKQLVLDAVRWEARNSISAAVQGAI